MKEIFIAAHEELIRERMELWCDRHPDAAEAEIQAEEAKAYDEESDRAHDRMTDKLADMADRIKDRMKEGGNWR